MTRMLYDPRQPSKAMSLANLRNTLGGLHQMDLAPLRVRASRVLDDMEYASNALAQGVWSGTGVTVTSSGTAQEGSYSIQVAIDGTGNRILSRSDALDLDAFESVKLWHRATTASATFKFFLEDSAGNISYWDVTTSGSSNTWVQETIALASPDSNNGSDADLSDITDWGFASLQASKTYLFDISKAICGMNVAVGAANVGSFYRNVYLENQPIETGSQTSPTITAPSANPRIDILTINNSGTLAWVTGSESSSPVPAWASLASNVLPIALVYMKTTMAKVVDFEEKDGNPNEGYILADVRPFLNLGSSEAALIEDEDKDTKIQVEESADEDAIRFDVKGNEVLRMEDDSQLIGTIFSKTGFSNWGRDGEFMTWEGNTPTFWYTAAGASVAKETGSGNVLYGSAAMKVTSDSDGSYVYQPSIGTIGTAENTHFRSKYVTFSCFVKSSVASSARISMSDGVTGSFSSYHSGGGGWEFLQVTKLLDASATTLEIQLRVDGNTNIAYFDGAMLVEGQCALPYHPSRAMRVYDSGWFAISTNGTYTKNHGLATTKLHGMFYGATSSSGTNMGTFILDGTGNDTSLTHVSSTQFTFRQGGGNDKIRTNSGRVSPTYARVFLIALD